MVKPLLAMLVLYVVHDVVFARAEREQLRANQVELADASGVKTCPLSKAPQRDAFAWSVREK